MEGRSLRKTIGMVGSRKRNSDFDFRLCRSAFKELYVTGDCVTSGGCYKGADRFLEIIAEEFCIPHTHRFIFKAQWHNMNLPGTVTARNRRNRPDRPAWYNFEAGFYRNTFIALISTHMICCISHDRSGGTEDTIKKFIAFHGSKNLFLVHDTHYDPITQDIDMFDL